MIWHLETLNIRLQLLVHIHQTENEYNKCTISQRIGSFYLGGAAVPIGTLKHNPVRPTTLLLLQDKTPPFIYKEQKMVRNFLDFYVNILLIHKDRYHLFLLIFDYA